MRRGKGWESVQSDVNGRMVHVEVGNLKRVEHVHQQPVMVLAPYLHLPRERLEGAS